MEDETSMLKEVCTAKLFLSSHIWVGSLDCHSLFIHLRYCLVACGENATPLCAWMITSKGEKWGTVWFLLWPQPVLVSAPALLQQCSHVAYSTTTALHLDLQKACSCLQWYCKILFVKGSFEFFVGVLIHYICIFCSLWISAFLRE